VGSIVVAGGDDGVEPLAFTPGSSVEFILLTSATAPAAKSTAPANEMRTQRWPRLSWCDRGRAMATG